MLHLLRNLLHIVVSEIRLNVHHGQTYLNGGKSIQKSLRLGGRDLFLGELATPVLCPKCEQVSKKHWVRMIRTVINSPGETEFTLIFGLTIPAKHLTRWICAAFVTA